MSWGLWGLDGLDDDVTGKTAAAKHIPGLEITNEGDMVKATINGEHAGWIEIDRLDDDTPYVANIEVEEKHRRKGVGTAMWEAAGRPMHDRPEYQTDAGKAWAKATPSPTRPPQAWDAILEDGSHTAAIEADVTEDLRRLAAADGHSLDDEGRVSVAEQVMERAGFGGQTFHVPNANVAQAHQHGYYDQYGQPDVRRLQREHSAEAERFVNDILRSHGHGGGIRVEPNDWGLREPGSGQAYTDGNKIALAGQHTNTLTLLHETAHVLTNTDHRDGHGPRFQQLLHALYHQHLGPEAASVFGDITGLHPRQARLAMPSRDAYDYLVMDRKKKTDDIPEQGSFYHGSDHEHQPGDILESVRARGDQNRIDYYENSIGAPNHADWVWMYNHPAPATKYHKNVYELEPLDEGPWIWNNILRDDGKFRPTENDEDFPRLVSPRARIVRKLPPEEHGAASAHLKDYYDRLRAERTAALNQDLVNKLDKQFHDWWTDTFAARYKAGAPEVKGWLDHGNPDEGPVSHWPNIEAFLKDRYPAAHKGHEMGLEEAARPLDGLGPMPYQQHGTADLTPYETGPEAVSKHGYDPAEVAASMLLLHNRSNPLRGDMEQRDVERLTDIAQKRYQMQRTYEQRTRQAAVFLRTAGFDPEEVTSRIAKEFREWAGQNRDALHPTASFPPERSWKNIEKFLKERYPAAHKGFSMGQEQAGDMLDYPEKGRRYQTGPRAVERHGYDPKEVAAGALLLHNRSHPFRMDQSADLDRLTRIFDKRTQMQRSYEQRNARLAAAPDEAIAHAQEVLARRDHYALHGAHPEGPQSLRGHHNAHHIDLTPAWAAETHYGALKRMAGAYHQAAERVLANPNDLDSHLRLLRHRDLLRVELQHSRKFAVPSLEHFSRIPDPDRHIGGELINPRFKAGTGDPDLASQRAYMINCQRCALAADANYHGLNVEAQQRYHSPKGGHTNDYIPKDHELAAWWRDANGVPAAWIDPQDHFAEGDDGPHHWDHMTRQIASWGPGGRAVIMASYPHPHANEFVRHVFNARVGDSGQVHYLDHQIRGSSGDHYRDRVDYTALDGRSRRKNILTTDPAARIVERNKIESPLRFLRTDDKTLAPETAKFLVDRGTADGTPIFAPHDPQGDR
jgi:hypothetical protein